MTHFAHIAVSTVLGCSKAWGRIIHNVLVQNKIQGSYYTEIADFKPEQNEVNGSCTVPIYSFEYRFLARNNTLGNAVTVTYIA